MTTRLAFHPMYQARRIAGRVHTLDSLRYRNFRLLFATTLLISGGAWTRVVVVGWLTFSLTQSPLMTSLALGLGALPLLIISPLGGILADMWDRRTILAVTIGFHAAAVAVLAAIVDSGPRSSLPDSLFALTIGLICTGLAASFAWLHYGLILPLKRSTAALADIQAGTAELSLEQLPAEEFKELASSIRETKQQLHEWKERAQNLSESVDRRVESLTRASTRARNRAEREAKTDVLSGLASRRTLERELPALVKSHRLTGCELAVAMIDVNDFKAYNDLKGHIAGDELIAFIGSLIRSSTRRNVDLTVRYGGDEFVIVMPNTGLADAVKIMKRMAAMFSQFVKTQSDLITPPSLAAGIACLHEDSVRTAEQLIELADAAMYRAKRGCLPVVTAGGA